MSLPSLYNVGKTYLLKEEDVKEKGYEFFEKAAGLGCPYSKWELYKSQNLMKDDNLDAGVMLEAIRTLHDVASNGNFLAAIELCKIYSMPDGGLASKKAAVDCYRKVCNLEQITFVFYIAPCRCRNFYKAINNKAKYEAALCQNFSAKTDLDSYLFYLNKKCILDGFVMANLGLEETRRTVAVGMMT